MAEIRLLSNRRDSIGVFGRPIIGLYDTPDTTPSDLPPTVVSNPSSTSSSYSDPELKQILNNLVREVYKTSINIQNIETIITKNELAIRQIKNELCAINMLRDGIQAIQSDLSDNLLISRHILEINRQKIVAKPVAKRSARTPERGTGALTGHAPQVPRAFPNK
jgi:hypothetical protein